MAPREELIRACTQLRDALEVSLIGQDEAKEGLLLALVARQHAYLEGPPGCGKTALAEALAGACGAEFAAIRFHRDLRDTDLLGDAVIRRERIDGGERIRRDLHPGPLLRAELALLDDLPRAPGEALGTLLRVLSERVALGNALPLESAIATAPPADAPEGYADPLEPSQLDRFAVQIRMRGLVESRDWRRSRSLLATAGSPATPERSNGIRAAERRAIQRAAAGLAIPSAVRAAWLRAVTRLVELSREAGGALLSDRAFGCAAISLLRAHALLRGADKVETRDLRVLRFMVARRVPARVLEWVDAVVEETVADAEGRETGGDTPPDDIEEGEGVEQGGSPDGARKVEERREETGEQGGEARDERADESAEVDALLRALRGRLDRGRVEREEDPGGSPRSLHPLRRFDEILDADPVEVQLLVEGRLLGMPRSLRREKPTRGGALVVLRDVSASMAGPFARWAGAVVAGLVHAGARRKMKVGYIEFNHEAAPLRVGESLLHRHYREVLAAAGVAQAKGRTNYEAPLRKALEALQEHRGANRHIILLTDGVPVLGDPVVTQERALAAELGVRIHTVFLGKGDCPRVLDAISIETDGMRFLARLDPAGRICVAERHTRKEAA